MLNRLVDEGFAERTGDPKDRRNTFYELTQSGLALLSGEIARRRGIVAARLEGFSRSERASLAQGIEDVFAGLEKLRSRRPEHGPKGSPLAGSALTSSRKSTENSKGGTGHE